MTTNKPEVVAYVDLSPGYRKWGAVINKFSPCTQDLKQGEALIRLTDYEALQTEIEKLKSYYRNGICDSAISAMEGYQHLEKQERQKRQDLQAECEKLRVLLSGVATAVGAHADPSCSLEFMAEISKEVESVVGRLRKDAATEQQIQRAAEELPDGWYIQAHVEKGSGYVDLYTPAGSLWVEELVGSIAEQIEQAIDAAMSGGE